MGLRLWVDHAITSWGWEESGQVRILQRIWPVWERTKMELIINITLDNDAFGETEGQKAYETARILRDFANKLESTEDFSGQNLRDINGNKVGKVSFEK